MNLETRNANHGPWAAFAAIACCMGIACAGEPAARDLLDTKALAKAGASITMLNHPNDDEAVVDDYTLVEYATNGAAVQWSDSCIKTLTEKGKRDNLSVSFGYDAAYETVMVDRIEVIKQDGTVVPVDIAAQSRTMVDSGQMGMNIYDPNSKTLSVGVPGLEIGDMRRVVCRHVARKARMADTWCDYNVFENTSPILHSTYEVFGPAAMPLVVRALKAEVSNTVSFASDAANGTNHYRWTVRNVPRMYDEPSMPERYTVVQRLLVSTIPDWQTVSRWYCNLSEPHLRKTTPGMSNEVATLVAGAATPAAAMEAVFHYVSQKIRYMGITTETTAPGYEPHDVDITFNNKYGVCRDKAALLVTMLRLAGLKAYPVLIMVGPKKDAEVPQPYFNHAIVGVETAPGAYTLMDPTDENTKDLFPAYLCNRSYLVAKPEGDILRTAPITPADENMLVVRTKGVLGKDGTLTAETVLDFAGINDNAYRGMLARTKAEERTRWFEGVVKAVVAGARLLDLAILPTNVLDTATNLVIRLSYEAKDVPVKGDKAVMVPPPWVGALLGVVNHVIGQTGLEERKYPFDTSYACGVRETFMLDLGEAVGAPLSLPIVAAQASSNISWHLALEQTGTFLAGSCEFKINTVEIAPGEYKELKRMRKTMEYDRRKRAVYAARGNDAESQDVRILGQSGACEIHDAHSATITVAMKQKILTYNGKKANAELKIGYNPTWDAVTLLYARVTAPDGTVKSIAPQEINLMDVGWAASAPRYPAAKTLVASLPNVDVGSIVEYAIARSVSNRPFLSFAEYFRGYAPVDTISYQLSAPDSMAIAVTGTPCCTMPAARTSAGGRTTWTWAVSNQPAVKSESSLPPWWQFNPGVLISAGAWPAYAAEVRGVLISAAAHQTASVARARQIVAGLKDDLARIRAIRDFIEKNVRAAGPSFVELPYSAITPADTTLADGYGNTTDRAVLYHAMLEAVGIAPELVLASWEPKGALRSPLLDCAQRGVFSDVLVRVPMGKDWIYLNDTDQYAEPGTTPHDGHPALMLATGAVEPVRAAQGKLDRTEIQFIIAFATNGDAVITQRKTIHGNAFSSFHQEYAEMPPEERRRTFLEMVAGVAQSAQAVGDLVTKYDAYPGIEEFTVKAERYGVNDGHRFYFALPGGALTLPGISADTRENPLYWGDECRMSVRVDVTLPGTTKNVLLCPRDFTWHAPASGGMITMATQRNAASNTLTLVREVDLQPAVIPASEYSHLLDTNRKLGHPDTHTVLVEMGE